MVKAADKALELTAKGKGRAFMAGALGGGIAEGLSHRTNLVLAGRQVKARRKRSSYL